MTTSNCPEGFNGGGQASSVCEVRSQWPQFKRYFEEKHAEHEGKVIGAIYKLTERVNNLAELFKRHHDQAVEAHKSDEKRISLLEERTNPKWEDETTEVKARRIENFRDLRDQMQAAVDRALLAERQKTELEQKQAKKYRRELILKIVALLTTAGSILVVVIDRLLK